jgi:hypothetical protein
MDWVFAVILFVAYVLSGLLPVRPLLVAGPIQMDWRDIIALAIVGIVIYALYMGQISFKDALVILGGILVGKIVAK